MDKDGDRLVLRYRLQKLAAYLALERMFPGTVPSEKFYSPIYFIGLGSYDTRVEKSFMVFKPVEEELAISLN